MADDDQDDDGWIPPGPGRPPLPRKPPPAPVDPTPALPRLPSAWKVAAVLIVLYALTSD